MKKLLLLLKGMAMGGADVVPGVSGGTIALITGIYEDFIGSIKSFDGVAFRLLFRFQLRDFWKHINGTFLLNVFAGILISIFSLAKGITYMLENHPIPLWSFFFGLILISAYYVMPSDAKVKGGIFLVVGLVIAYLITSLSPAETPEQLWFVFLSGAVAICAMILPGISGSFILLLLGKYEFVLEAVKNLDLGVIAVFGAGCAIGIVTFSKLIHWLLSNHRIPTMALLAGFMLGSLNKIWPWKLEEAQGFVNLSPQSYSNHTGDENQLLLAIVCCVAGIALVASLEVLGKKYSK